MMDGRVKTLHPVVHGGLLGVRDAPEHAAAMAEHGIGAIDLLYVNLYPFEATVAARRRTSPTCVENIDIGGPAMIRSAAKNHAYVAVCTEPEDMAEVLEALKAGGDDAGAAPAPRRPRLRPHRRLRRGDLRPGSRGRSARRGRRASRSPGQLKQTMRYGENPHQAAALYAFPNPRPGVATARQLQGKELSYNNINDTDAAVELVAEFDPGRRARRSPSSSTPTPAAWRSAPT